MLKVYSAWSLDEWVEMFVGIYGSGNESTSDSDLWLHVVEEVGELAEGLRKIDGSDDEFLENIADTFAWMCAFAERYGSFEDMVWEKYPSACFYCVQEIDCVCPVDKKDEEKLKNLSTTERPSNLYGWQNMLNRVYGKANQERTLEEIGFHLFEEIGEVAKALRKKDPEEIRNELADSFAWLAALINRYDSGLQLGDIIWKRYPDKCPHCETKPCKETYND
ncbi:hypothetical protein J4457_06240 [Candidatus Woesearchaeota archaeon]|nr:hypothetical protein [Candidatus Woesearchaeota archaeon]